MVFSNTIFRLLKKTTLILLMLTIAFSGYVAIVTHNTTNMTIRQRILKATYPLFTWLSKKTGMHARIYTNELHSLPAQSIYDLSVTLNTGETVSLQGYKGKKLMIVNTASDCGYTDQFAELEELYKENKDKLVVLGFPANDFKEQEKGTDEEIARFCKINYGVTFPLVKKSSVLPGPLQNTVFQWLTDKNKNGWSGKKPSWNFSKYLVNENGVLLNYFDPSISPTGKEIKSALKK